MPTLLNRVKAELSASFVAGRPMRVSRAPGRLDAMGGIADYTGSLVCEATLDRAAAVATQRRDDRTVQVFSFNLFDEHQPFTLSMSLDDIAGASVDELRAGFTADPGRKWAGYVIGCLALLHEQGYVKLDARETKGFNIAVLSTVALGAGISSSAALEVATMVNLVDEFGIARLDPESSEHDNLESHEAIGPMRLASLCQQVENRVVGAPCGVMDQVTSCYGRQGALLRLVCQPHELQPALYLPVGVRLVGINSNVKHSVGGGQYGKTRCAAFMGHAMILAKMAEMAHAANLTLSGDPMHGYLANLDLDDYKRYFRGYLPEWMEGKEFVKRFGKTIDKATTVEPDVNYPVQHATDHHVWEAHRVKNFTSFVEEAGKLPSGPERSQLLDKAGHLMYASHVSYTKDAMLGADECDLLVDLVRRNERAGLFGAKITGGGSGGTVAVLCHDTPAATAAIEEILTAYQAQTGRTPEAFMGSSPGAWHVGSAVV
jgi:L-arabinokinase